MNPRLLATDTTYRQLALEGARLDFYTYCQLLYPKFYRPDRPYLKTLCERLQRFLESDDRHFLVVNLAPRHGKSLTAQNLVEWGFGRDTSQKIMTASYNEILSGVFSRKVRNTLQTQAVGEGVVYADIFPNTKVKYGDAAATLWSLEGSPTPSYLATSPGGTMTGVGASLLLVDDIIKSYEEAVNDTVLDKHWDWFANVALSRLEGRRKVVVIMTRWAERDLAGRVVETFGEDVDIVKMPAVNADGSMLCDSVLSREAYERIRSAMSLEIVEANYNQAPIDVKGRLFEAFREWSELPKDAEGAPMGVKYNYTDTADRGSDSLCSVNYTAHGGNLYITDVVFTDEPIEATQDKVVRLLKDVDYADIESNNGGRAFSLLVEQKARAQGNNRTIISTPTTTTNKETRIIATSGWAQTHIFMPQGWQQKWPGFARELMGYQRKGKNAHDDAPDVIAMIADKHSASVETKQCSQGEVQASDYGW